MKTKNQIIAVLLILNTVFSISGLCAQNFVHPGGLVTQDDIERIKYLKDVEGDATIKAAFAKLQANNHAKSTYNPNPQVRVDRGGTEYSDNYSIAMNDVAAAYQNALMWRITGNAAHADCAVRILNSWARTCKDITGDTNASLASGIYGYEFAQAGELLRGYSGWAVADFKAYQNWMRNLWYPRAMYFIVNRHGRTCATNEGGAYLSNWGLCNLLAIMSIGILCDDVAIYNQGLHFYKDDICGNFTDEPRNPIRDIGNNEFLGNLVVWLHPDARGPYGFLGQMQESGRDQGHATMAAGLAADVCQTAWNQGDDLYAYMNNRIAAGFEYIALVNSLDSQEQVADSVSFHPYLREGLPTENYLMTSNGLGGWGSARPYWDRVVAHYEGIKGVKMRYSEKMRAKTGIDGGGGDYGGNSGGFDHLGFSTLTNYIPTTWYPAAGYTPVTLGTSITYNGNTTYDNRLNGVTSGSMVTLTPTLPTGVAETGTWKWQTGETTRELTFAATKSGIYRVTYTAANGVRSTQAFNIAVWGDCTPEIISYKTTVGDTSYNDTVITVLPYQKFSMSIGTAMYSRGSAVWNTGNTGFTLTMTNGVRNDSVFWVEHTNEGGYKTRYNFHVKLMYVRPSVSIDGGNAASTGRATVQAGQSVEMKPVTTIGYDNGTFCWSTGHKSKNLIVLNVQKAAKYQLYYTLTKNNTTTIDTLDFNVSVVRNNYQLPNGDYYIRRATDGAYLTNPNATAANKVKPYFTAENQADAPSQIWTISKETASDAGGRFKMVSKKDGNYVNENADFGTNQYYSAWNTYTFHALEGEDLYAIQNGGSSGTNFWIISGDQITGKGSDVQNGYPFLITPVVPQPDNSELLPGENVLSYIAPAYSIEGGASQRGDQINVTSGKKVVLKPVKVTGIFGGTWLWSDNSTATTLDLGAVQNGGTYSVDFTYPEGDTTYIFPLAYTVMLTENDHLLPEGDYMILRASDDRYLTNDGTLNPVFSVISSDSITQIWTITHDLTTSRHKIVSKKDGRFVGEHGRFNNSSYAPERNTYLFHYEDAGERVFAIQNAGSAGSTYWAVEGDMVNDRNHTSREGYPFKFLSIASGPSGIESAVAAQAKIYPNPAVEYVVVETENSSEFTLYSTDGSAVAKISCFAGSNRINVSDLPKGIYIGVLETEGQITRFKLIKQ